MDPLARGPKHALKVALLGTVLSMAFFIATLAATPAAPPRLRLSASSAVHAAREARSSSLLYYSEPLTNVIEIVDARRFKPVGSLTSGLNEPQGLTFDGSGTLYVVNLAQSKSYVAVFPPGSTSPSREIPEPAGFSYAYVAAAASDGTLYVLYFKSSGGSCTDAAVEVYSPGGSEPSRQIDIGIDGCNGLATLAVDAKNNLYVAYLVSNGTVLERFAPGQSKGKKQTLTNSFADDFGFAIDSHENKLLTVDTASNFALMLFPKKKSTPPKTLVDSATTVAFDRSLTKLYVNIDDSTVEGYNYPSMKPFGAFNVSGFISGLAVW